MEPGSLSPIPAPSQPWVLPRACWPRADSIELLDQRAAAIPAAGPWSKRMLGASSCIAAARASGEGATSRGEERLRLVLFTWD